MEQNDYELVFLAKEGNEDAINLLYQKYKPIIVSKSKDAILKASHHGIEISDIMQEGYIALDDAINNFSETDNTSFYTFALVCIERKIINYLRKTTGGKYRILNEAVAIDEYVEKSVKDEVDAEISFLTKENRNDIIDRVEESLTGMEKIVFQLKIEGYNFLEIANTLNKDLKSIYNTFHRVKLKIKKIMEEDDCL